MFPSPLRLTRLRPFNVEAASVRLLPQPCLPRCRITVLVQHCKYFDHVILKHEVDRIWKSAQEDAPRGSIL